MTLTPSKLTTHQRHTLVRLRSRERVVGDGVSFDLRDFGTVAAVRHLIRKGAVSVTETLVGPRGGEYPQVALTGEGRRVADYIVVNRLKTY